MGMKLQAREEVEEVEEVVPHKMEEVVEVVL